jgi:hypothetical protein
MQSNTHPNEWVQYIFQSQSMVQNQRHQDRIGTSTIRDQPQEISSLESDNSHKKDVTRGIQPMLVYQSTSPNYCEPMEDSKVEENTNIDVVGETEGNYL